MNRQVGLKGRLPDSLLQRWSLCYSLSSLRLLLETFIAITCLGSDCLAAEPLGTPQAPVTSTAALPIVDARVVGCRGAENWKPSELLHMRARTLVQLYREEDDCARSAAQTLATFLNQQAAYQEDIGAASAMRAYYTRIAIVEQLRLLAESLELVDVENQRQTLLMQQGSAAASDISAFERQRIEILDQETQLNTQERQLQSLLVQLTRLDYLCNEVHQERLDVFPAPLDCTNLKALALMQRQDLQAWKLLASRVNEDTAPEFAKMLPTLVGGWTLPLPSLRRLGQLICKDDYSCLAANMRAELNTMAEAQADWICQTVGEKCSQLEMSYERIELAGQVIRSWENRIEQLERLRSSGAGKPDQSAIARAELLKARSTEISRRLDARLAELDLAEATGGLALRCCRGQAWLQTGL